MLGTAHEVNDQQARVLWQVCNVEGIETHKDHIGYQKDHLKVKEVI